MLHEFIFSRMFSIVSGLLACDYVIFYVSPGHFFVTVGAGIPVQAKMLLSYVSSTILRLRETLSTRVAMPIRPVTCDVGRDISACETPFGFTITND